MGLLNAALKAIGKRYGQGIHAVVDTIRIVDNIPLTLTLSDQCFGMGTLGDEELSAYLQFIL